MMMQEEEFATAATTTVNITAVLVLMLTARVYRRKVNKRKIYI